MCVWVPWESRPSGLHGQKKPSGYSPPRYGGATSVENTHTNTHTDSQRVASNLQTWRLYTTVREPPGKEGLQGNNGCRGTGVGIGNVGDKTTEEGYDGWSDEVCVCVCVSDLHGTPQWSSCIPRGVGDSGTILWLSTSHGSQTERVQETITCLW